jgi:hypothetical protein
LNWAAVAAYDYEQSACDQQCRSIWRCCRIERGPEVAEDGAGSQAGECTTSQTRHDQAAAAKLPIEGRDGTYFRGDLTRIDGYRRRVSQVILSGGAGPERISE